jgi:hypothetical protein
MVLMVQGLKKEYFFRDARLNRICVLEDLDFYFDRIELKEIKEMWEKGEGVYDIAVYFERDPDEIVLALMHLAREDKISQRKGGLKG